MWLSDDEPRWEADPYRPILVLGRQGRPFDFPPELEDRAAMTSRRFLATFLLAAAVGCSSPDPAARNEVLAPGDEWNRTVLDRTERDEVRSILREAVRTDDPAFPQPAPHGMRWSDVPAAAKRAAARIEAAVVVGERWGTIAATGEDGPSADPFGSGFLMPPPVALVGDIASGPERWVFELKTIRDEPAWLVVPRGAGGAEVIGEVVAEVGIAGERRDDAARLVAAFDEALRALGRRPSFAR